MQSSNADQSLGKERGAMDAVAKEQHGLLFLHKFVVEQLKVAIDKQLSFAK